MILVVSISTTVFVSNDHSPGTKNFCDKTHARLLLAYQNHVIEKRLNFTRFVLTTSSKELHATISGSELTNWLRMSAILEGGWPEQIELFIDLVLIVGSVL